MIGIIFQFGSEYVEVRIENSKVLFRTQTYGTNFVPIELLKLNKEGVIKEFPDLQYSETWREDAINRFKMKIKDMASEEEVVRYIIEDLSKYGYIPKFKQRTGFRIEKIR